MWVNGQNALGSPTTPFFQFRWGHLGFSLLRWETIAGAVMVFCFTAPAVTDGANASLGNAPLKMLLIRCVFTAFVMTTHLIDGLWARACPSHCLYTCLCMFVLHRRNEHRLKVRLWRLQLLSESVLKTKGCCSQLGSVRQTQADMGTESSPPTVQIWTP